MEAKELRLGNYYDHNGEIRQVTPDTILEVWEAQRIWCKPIKLTEDWLVKLGFEKDYEGDFMFAFNGRVYYYNLEKGFLLKDFKIKSRLNQFPIFSLHQLQNLYFALTGEELIINQQNFYVS